MFSLIREAKVILLPSQKQINFTGFHLSIGFDATHKVGVAQKIKLIKGGFEIFPELPIFRLGY